MATKKKRPPRQVWLVMKDDDGWAAFHEGHYTPVGEVVHMTKKEAEGYGGFGGRYIVGPYVLAERVKQR